MSRIKFYDSNYRFTDPVRFFKANDPYYWEVDNIPLKQIHENTLWLKDQVAELNTAAGVDGIDRNELNELKPYVEGSDSTVKVKPGRFTARINDAYSLNRLQIIRHLTGFDITESNTWAATLLNDQVLGPLLENFKFYNTQSSFGMNGLSERAFTYPVLRPRDGNQVITPGNTANIDYPDGINTPPYPITEVQLWANNSQRGTEFVLRQYDNAGALGFASLGVAETNFVKLWRGVTRTAVVDVPSELSITIPEFNVEDFYYTNEAGNRVPFSEAEEALAPNAVRIDLLFVYSKPVDTSSTTIAKFINDNPTKINRPQLGLVLGAGIGMNFTEGPLDAVGNSSYKNYEGIDSQGRSKILADPSDLYMNYGGFGVTGEGDSGIKGSFPVPDDLMNLSPLLSETLPEEHYSLIGQTILPLAYIVVRRDAPKNDRGTPILTSADVIDIRPFLRTTELSYNERAGIAAAVPQLSIANPVATQAELDYEIKRAYRALRSQITSLSTSISAQTSPKIVGGGYVKGGFNFGVEGAICKYISDTQLQGSVTTEALKSAMKTRYGLPNDYSIPDYPDWDVAPWVEGNNLPNAGQYPNDRIHVHAFNGDSDNLDGHSFGSYSNFNLSSRLNKIGTKNWRGKSGMMNIFYVKKRIFIDRSSVNWMDDYHVDVQLWNCAPMSCQPQYDYFVGGTGTNAVWVEKQRNEFTIYVAWVAQDQFFGGNRDDNHLIPAGAPPFNGEFFSNRRIQLPDQREETCFAGFVVINRDIELTSDSSQMGYLGQSGAGIATYPTITFQITGFPVGTSQIGSNLNARAPTISLV